MAELLMGMWISFFYSVMGEGREEKRVSLFLA